MTLPRTFDAIPVHPDTLLLPSLVPIPGLGVLPVNHYLLRGEQNVLIDTGMAGLGEATVSSLKKNVDLDKLDWIVLTHTDGDHLGALPALLELAPKARIVTNFLGMAKLGMRLEVAPDRYFLINPGQRLSLGDRELLAVTLPSYDAPETMGFFDPRTETLFSSDCFGALLDDSSGDRPRADLSEVDSGVLRKGIVTWAGVDAPWLSTVTATAFQAQLAELAALRPRTVLGAHLPPARDCLDRLSRELDGARKGPRFVGPDQAMLEAMLHAA